MLLETHHDVWSAHGSYISDTNIQNDLQYCIHIKLENAVLLFFFFLHLL